MFNTHSMHISESVIFYILHSNVRLYHFCIITRRHSDFLKISQSGDRITEIHLFWSFIHLIFSNPRFMVQVLSCFLLQRCVSLWAGKCSHSLVRQSNEYSKHQYLNMCACSMCIKAVECMFVYIQGTWIMQCLAIAMSDGDEDLVTRCHTCMHTIWGQVHPLAHDHAHFCLNPHVQTYTQSAVVAVNVWMKELQKLIWEKN